MCCKFCNSKCIKKGKRNGKQIYRCKGCLKYQRLSYSRNRLITYDLQMVLQLNNEGMGIRSISRVLNIPKSTVGKLLIFLSEQIHRPDYTEYNQEYEVDELRTFVGKKSNECWLCYAINRTSRKVIDFMVGRRTKSNLKRIIHSLLRLQPKKIYTDRLNSYPSLIPKHIHSTKFRSTNHIERYNLTLRTHLKRLNRNSLCFSKSQVMLAVCLKLYFWY